MGQTTAVAKRMKKVVDEELIVPHDNYYKCTLSIYDPIARRAYERFLSRGCVHGYDREDWYQAESELLQPVNFEVSDSGDTFIAITDVTGYRPQDVRVTVDLRSLKICGQALAENKPSGQSQEEMRAFAGFALTLDLPASIDTSQATADIRHNVLEVRLPKAPPRVAYDSERNQA